MRYLVLLLLVMTGCYEDPCENILTYYENVPVIAYEGDEPIYLGYYEQEKVMGQCECLAVLNNSMKEYNNLLVNGDTSLIKIYQLYPPYYECR